MHTKKGMIFSKLLIKYTVISARITHPQTILKPLKYTLTITIKIQTYNELSTKIYTIYATAEK